MISAAVVVKPVQGEHFKLGEQRFHPAEEFDCIFMRKDPPFDTDFFYATHLLSLVDAKKTFVFFNNCHVGQAASGGPRRLKAGAAVTAEYLDELPHEEWFEIQRSRNGAAWLHLTNVAANATNARFLGGRAEPEEDAQVEDSAHAVLYTQWLKHPRLRWASRRLELSKREPRARLRVRFNRLTSTAPEAFSARSPS